MKIIADGYSFDPILKRITFSGFIPPSLASILLVTNVTRGKIYFVPQDGISGAYENPVLTLSASVSTAGHEPADRLQIFVDDGLLPASAANQTLQLAELQAIRNAPKGYDPIYDKLVVGTSRDKLRDEFITLDTINTWDVIAAGAGMNITVDGVANGARYLNVATGVTASAETIIQSRSTFRLPVKLGFALSMSQRIANQEVFVELVGVDANGAVETDTLYPSTNFNNAANAAGYKFDGTTATNAIYSVRSSGASELVSPAQAFGATTAATGTGPNFIPAGVWEIAADMEECVWQTRPIDSLSAVQAAFKRTHRLPDPQKQYKVRIRVRNLSTAPASTTSVRLHFLRVLDTTRFTIDFARQMGRQLDAADALPVAITSGILTSVATVSTVSNVAAISAGANAIGDVGSQYRASATGAASTSKVVSAATTNPTVVKATAGRVVGWSLANTSTSWRYVKLHNVAIAPTPGSTAVLVPIAIPPGSTSIIELGGGIAFGTGIAYSIVTGAADADATAIGLNEVVGSIFFA